MNAMCPRPEKGESKQAYLSRCVHQCTEGGMSESEAFSACTLEAQTHKLSLDLEPQHLVGSVTFLKQEPASETSNASADADAAQADKNKENAAAAKAPRRFAILAYTGQPFERWFGPMIIDLQGMRVNKASIPALRDHKQECIVGYTQKSEMTATGLHLHGVFSMATNDAREVLALADEGFPWQASIGVKPLVIQELKQGASAEVNGMTVQGPMYIATESVVYEISFCPLGADSNTAAIAMAGKEQAMKGESPAASAETFPVEVSPELTNILLHNAALAAEPLQPQENQGAQNQQALAQQSLEKERQRVDAILTLCATHNLISKAQAWIMHGLDFAQVQKEALESLAAGAGGAPVASITMGISEGDKFRALASEGLCLSLGIRVEKPQDGSRQFMGMGLLDMAKLSLSRAGCNVMGLSPSQVADAIFSRNMRLSASVADFSAVFMDVANKRLLQSYAEAGRTYDLWTSRVNARDFKQMHGVSLSEASNLEKVGENEEYKSGSLSDGKETYRVYKYGKILRISWEMLVNDDLNAFARVPSMLGASTARTFSDVVYGVLTSDAKMSDGKPIFDDTHKNISKPAAGITNESMDAARLTMRMQTGKKGARLNLSPAFLLVPPSLENTAYVLLKSGSLPKEGMSNGVYNPWGDSRITPIVEQRLEPESNTARPWYLTASPASVSTVDVAYLDGKDVPDIIEHVDFTVDAFSYKARACIGAAAVDFRGMVKNPGIAR